MQRAKPSKVQSSINVTPLVDVVLVLLIIFMVIAPQLHAGPELQLPETEAPEAKPENEQQILVAIERGGILWIDEQQVTAEEFPERIREAAERHPEHQVVLKGDARLSYGEVKQAMLAIESAGFADVGLIAERRERTEE